MTDELITELAKNRELQVISRTSVMQYKSVHRPLRTIARELGADEVVEGTVALDGTKVRVTVQLIHVSTDSHLWAQRYERDLGDAMTLQAELARNIAGELKTTVLTTARPTKSINAEAHDYYLQGRYAWFSGNGEKAKEFFEKAGALQPDYAEAYSGLSAYYGAYSVRGLLDPKQAMPEAEKYAKKALELDETLADGHNSMGAVYLFYRWDWKKAEAEERRAIELNPSFAEAYHVLAYVLLAENRAEEAVAAQRKGSHLDPFERPWALGYVLSCVEKYPEAELELRHELDLRPTNTDVRRTLATVLRMQGKEKESAAQLAEAARRDGNPSEAGAIEKAFAKGGDAEVQRLQLQSLEARTGKAYVSPMAFAYAYARLGNKGKTSQWLEKAYVEHSPRLVRLMMEPDLKGMHGDPEFMRLVQRVGLIN